MNGYFRLMHTAQDTSIRLFPPTEGGEPIEVSELTSYLQIKNITNVDMKALYSALKDLKEPVLVKLCGPTGYEEQEMMSLTISADKMQAVARFYPPSSGGTRMTAQEIVQDIMMRNVRLGIDQNAINSFIKNPQYCTNIVVARGIEPVQGKDAEILYSFNTDPNMRPARNEDGSVDFFNLNTINHCKEGEILATLIKEVPGKPGSTLLGETIRPREVKRKVLKYGRNITLTEDGLQLISQINGHVSLVEGKVFVSNVLELENIGPATGNIEAEGSVVVGGNVQAGYSIKASGNVEVHGVVEGATIEAGGDIILTRGMNGMGKGVLRAGGSIISKFFENSTIYSGNYVESDSILHSTVNAKNEVSVDGRKGFIAGGSVRATNRVTCRTLGSQMGADTFIEVGIDPQQKLHYQDLQKEMREIQKNIKGIQPILMGLQKKIKDGVKLTPEQVEYFKKLADTSVSLSERLDECETEFDELEETMQGSANACVKVRDTAYVGTKVSITEASLFLKKNVTYCRFVYEKGEVKVTTY